MKKILAIISVLVCVFCAAGVTAFADCGPKESLTVYMTGIEEGREYYITLLSSNGSRRSEEYIAKQPPEWQAIYEFSLTDEYFLWDSPVDRSYCRMSGSGRQVWGYFPPQKFKILLYFPDENTFLLSEKLERYAFNSYFTFNVNDGEMTVAKNGGAGGVYVEIGGLLIRIVITVLLELGMARLFGYSDSKTYKLIIIMNVCTQVFLNIMIAVGDMWLGGLGAAAAYFLAEILVFTVEASVYAVVLPRLTERKTRGGMAVGYAFAANAASFFIGGILLVIGEVFFEAVAGH